MCKRSHHITHLMEGERQNHFLCSMTHLASSSHGIGDIIVHLFIIGRLGRTNSGCSALLEAALQHVVTVSYMFWTSPTVLSFPITQRVMKVSGLGEQGFVYFYHQYSLLKRRVKHCILWEDNISPQVKFNLLLCVLTLTGFFVLFCELLLLL